MEIDLENMIMSEEQAHLFAVDIYNEVVQYFKELDEHFSKVCKFLEEFAVNAVLTLGGAIIIRDNSYQYNLCKYTKIF